MTKLWRVTNKGQWPEFTKDVEGSHVGEAIDNFEKAQKERSSSATRKEITKIELLGDTNGS